MSEDRGHGDPHQFEQRVRPFGVGQCGETGAGRAVRGGRDGGTAAGGPHEAAQRIRHRLPGRRVEVQPHWRDDGVVAPHRGVEQRESRLLGEGTQPGTGQPRRVRGHAGGGLPRPPGEGHRRQPPGTPQFGQSVEERVGGGVVALAWGAEQSGGRRVQHEGGQVEVFRCLVQVPGARDLGAQHPVERVVVECGDDGVVEDPGRVHDDGQRVFRGDVRDEACDVVGVGHVAGHRGDGRAEIGERDHDPVGVGAAAPAGQDHVPDLVRGDQVPGQRGAEGAGAARDERGAVGVRGGWHGEHHLADVPCLAEVAEGLRCPAHVPGGDGQRGQLPLVEEREEFGQHGRDAVRPGVDHVERLVPHAVVRLGHGEGVADVGLAHLHEPPAGGQQAQGGVDERAGERVEHDVHAASAGGRAEALLEPEGA